MKIFIGSSSEAKEKAEHIARILCNKGHDARVWYDCFPAGKYTLEALIDAANTFDAGVFVFACDDTIIAKDGSQKAIMRGNVLMESGLFMGALGRKNVCIFLEMGVEYLSDFRGLTYIEYADQDYAIKEKLLSWISSISSNNDKIYISNDRYIEFSFNGYVENIMSYPESVFVIPINNQFDLTNHRPSSIHSDFFHFIKEQGNDIDDIQLKLDESLEKSIISSKGNGRPYYLLGTVGRSYFNYKGKQKLVLFYGNSQKDHILNNEFYGNNCMPYDIWKYLSSNGIRGDRILMPLVGSGNAGPTTSAESAMNIIDAYISYYGFSFIRNMIISIPRKKFENDHDLKYFKDYINFKKEMLKL